MALAVLGTVGIGVLDDYGVSPDTPIQRDLGHATLDLALGDDAAFSEILLPFPELEFYGAVFEVPLALLGRALGQTDSRDIHLTRHLLSHLCFLVGAGAAALLARRLFGGTWPAVLALTIFALHPRLYAHSFFNSKDAPFAALFMVCLCLVERAFRRCTPGAFALLGIGVGALVNLRFMGVLLLAAVLALRALDVALASGTATRRRALVTGAVFTGAAVLTLYAVSPYLWTGPSRLVDALSVLPRHPVRGTMLLQGTLVQWPDIPAHYIPTWIAITSPPGLLALCLVGATVACRGLIAPAGIMRNAAPRFGLLLAACPMLAVLASVAVNGNLKDGWRHMYFLWAPASLLAVAGVFWLVRAGRRRALRRGAGGLAAACIGVNLAHLASMHPQQALHFNLLVDRDAPERLGAWYETDYFRMSYHEGLKHLLTHYPEANIDHADHRMRKAAVHGLTLPAAWRPRFAFNGPVGGTDLVVRHYYRTMEGRGAMAAVAPTVYALRVYDNTFLTATAFDVSFMNAADAARWRGAYQAATTLPRVATATYDLHLDPHALFWLKAPCGRADARGEFVMTTPHGLGGQRFGWAPDQFACRFARCGVRVGNACMVRTPLPHHSLKSIEAGQRLRNGPDLWRVGIDLSPPRAVSRDVTRPTLPPVAPLTIDAPFDLYWDGTTLTYVKESCRVADTLHGFFLHVLPKELSALPAGRRRIGFDNLDFEMERYDEGLIAALGGRCVASRRLPDYPIAALRTGHIENWQRLWTAHIRLPGTASSGE